jgi:hypothetical protein
MSTYIRAGSARLWMFFIAAGFFCLFVAPRKAWAATCSLTVTPTVSAPCNALNWGALAASGGSDTKGVDTANTQSGTGTWLYGTTPICAAFTVTDNTHCGSTTISITLTGTGGATGVTLSWPTNAFLKYNGTAFANGATGLSNPSSTTLLVGALATYTSSATKGSVLSPTYNINVVESTNTLNFPETASIEFDTPISITPVSQINFGYARAGTAGTYAINTAGTVTPSGGGVIEPNGTTAAGDLNIIGPAGDTINITVGSETASNGVSITAGSELCKYGAAAETACSTIGNPVAAPTPTGTHLKLGATAVANGTQTDGTVATPTFNVNVVYQ